MKKTNSYEKMGSSLLVAVILSLLSHSYSFGQNILTNTVSWNSVKAVSQSDNNVATYSSTFTSNANSFVEWSQNNGKSVSRFNVTSVTGQWANLAIDGKVTYHVQNGSVSGTIDFLKSNGQTTIHLNVFVDGKQDLNYVFTISSITAQ